MNGYGIDSLASFFLDYGYSQREELRFPAKKLRALWFSPPAESQAGSGSGINGPLPRIFISELLLDQMSPPTQVCLPNVLQLVSFCIYLCSKNCNVKDGVCFSSHPLQLVSNVGRVIIYLEITLYLWWLCGGGNSLDTSFEIYHLLHMKPKSSQAYLLDKLGQGL